ncbi:glucose-6-phosphate dehydrogenase [Rhodovulum sp. DZ06]|uniref:glucose-6-phosphate dehydrogenase n=1 Tax=Rhodovulum sp. DZ06 TaxID=3425126 RepID=UPI003D33F210
MVARIIPVPSFDLTVFGGTGDLARRKLIPALYRRMRDGQAPRDARILAAARSDLDDAGFRAMAREALEEHVPAAERPAEDMDAFLAMLGYVKVDAMGTEGWDALAERLADQPDRPRAFYLSVAPSLFGPIAERIAGAGLGGPNTRIVVEKPLGRDLEGARALNAQLAEHFDESQLYRIDHYLGKETVQNLMAIRFANALFEPVWNARHIDHVQITVAESLGVGGRGEYYDRSGAMRDMVQNHLMQLLCLTAMEPPNMFDPDAVRDEKLKVIRALDPIGPGHIGTDTVRGQYRGGPLGPSYVEDAGDPDSHTECFVALKAEISNWRWAGAPFYLRTGKRLRARMSEIAIQFKAPPHSIFEGETCHGNTLVIRLQPDEGITLKMTVKDPGPGGMRLIETPLDMTFAKALEGRGVSMPDAYERLIMDVIRGDQTLFMRGDEVEAAWAWVDPIIAAWEHSGAHPQPYDSGGSGPEDALMLMHRDGRRWREIA